MKSGNLGLRAPQRPFPGRLPQKNPGRWEGPPLSVPAFYARRGLSGPFPPPPAIHQNQPHQPGAQEQGGAGQGHHLNAVNDPVRIRTTSVCKLQIQCAIGDRHAKAFDNCIIACWYVYIWQNYRTFGFDFYIIMSI